LTGLGETVATGFDDDWQAIRNVLSATTATNRTTAGAV
jgi:hypothetical protein